MVLADGAAHKQIWGSNEHAGTKQCTLRANIGSADQPILKHNQLTTDNEECLVSKVETGRWQSLGIISVEFIYRVFCSPIGAGVGPSEPKWLCFKNDWTS